MSFADSYIRIAQKILPTPFTIAALLTLATIAIALLFTEPDPTMGSAHFFQVIQFWETGIWELLAFTMQMMLILVLGHVLALTRPVSALIRVFVGYCTDTSRAAAIVVFFTMLVAYFNWGLGLIFGAIFARKVGEFAKQHNIPINYPLVSAAGYAGLMVWHGGLSGSAPITVTGADHSMINTMGVLPLSETTFSTMNIVVFALCMTLIPAVMYLMGKVVKPAKYKLKAHKSHLTKKSELSGAEKLDHSGLFSIVFGGLIMTAAFYKFYLTEDKSSLSFLTLNYINLCLFGMGILLHGNLINFVNAAQKAIGGSTGIMIQFPLYAGIMGIMKYSGLIVLFSDFFIGISNAFIFPFFVFISAGITNVFVPSGGGQWQVQGPVIIEAARELGVPYSKTVMALAYGDQLTNMLQPFWALPLLGITGLKAKEILPYTLLLMCVGFVIFSLALLFF